ncbi:MAG: glutamine synthetase family protein [Bdellovibrionota bacterium]
MASANSVLQLLRERGVERLKVGAFDTDGVLRGKYLSLEKAEGVLESGFGFCDVIFGWDSADVLYDHEPETARKMYTGWHTGYPDALAKLDPKTLRFIPWESNTAFMLADFYTPGGSALPICPRQVLKRVVQRAHKLGFEPMAAVEFEFFIFKESPETVREKGYRHLTPLTPGMFGYSVVRASSQQELVHSILKSMKDYDIDLEGFHTETGPGVYEAAIKYDTILNIADKAALFKTAMKEIASRHGVMVSFMAKVNQNLPGCSGHIHQSLWDRDLRQNLFADQKSEFGMSAMFKQYVAGQLELMPEMMALISPTINSYKRTGRHTMAWAPCNATWALDNRTAALRVILGPNGAGKPTRVEYRLAAADINPYHALAASLAGGLYGIESKLVLQGPLKGSAYAVSAKEAQPLPTSLEEATEKLNQSERAREYLGSAFIDHYVATRRWEVEQFRRAVTSWELERYFEII